MDTCTARKNGERCTHQLGHRGMHHTPNGTRWANRSRKPTPKPSWYTPDDAAADRAARYGTTPATTDSDPGGALAWWDDTCPRCDEPITRHVSTVVKRGERWIHAGCASGQDDA